MKLEEARTKIVEGFLYSPQIGNFLRGCAKSQLEQWYNDSTLQSFCFTEMSYFHWKKTEFYREYKQLYPEDRAAHQTENEVLNNLEEFLKGPGQENP